MYESIAIVAKRANQINISLKEELHNKLDEFASHTDSLEEIHENKEQIEISKAYEHMPNPAILATRNSWKIKSTTERQITICSLKNSRNNVNGDRIRSPLFFVAMIFATLQALF